MIEPMLSLAFSMHSNKGVYALLLGSGVSRSAGIPTGWEVVLDLIQKLAHLQGEDCEPDPAAWYKAKFKEEPDYAKLLDQLARSPAERNQLLREYFEPNDEEREHGLKMPTEAHNAIAELVTRGHIRVIVTTNFDRLFERALETVGITPAVISTPDAVQGALPVQHTACTIIKVHGDYMDTRIKNSPDELASYDARFDLLLDRIFDEYGLIICGWSAEWDRALYSVFERCSTHRFTTYWAVRGMLGGKAQRLVQVRRAQTIATQGADAFFGELAEKVSALEEYAQPHPLSAKLAVVSLKKYLVDDRHRIRLHDLVMEQTNKLYDELFGGNFPLNGVAFTAEELRKRVQQYEALSQPVLALTTTGCYWGQKQHEGLWAKCLERIANPPAPSSWMDVWFQLQRYPALLMLYAGGIAALVGEQYGTFATLLTRPTARKSDEEIPITLAIPPRLVMSQDVGRMLVNRGDLFVPVSEHLYEVLREPLREFLTQDQQYDEYFDRFEYLFALVYAHLDYKRYPSSTIWGPHGRFGWKRHNRRGPHISDKVNAESVEAGDNWGILRAGLFDGSLETFQTIKTGFDENVNKSMYW